MNDLFKFNPAHADQIRNFYVTQSYKILVDGELAHQRYIQVVCFMGKRYGATVLLFQITDTLCMHAFYGNIKLKTDVPVNLNYSLLWIYALSSACIWEEDNTSIILTSAE